jgi:uracil-DNA glycosylase
MNKDYFISLKDFIKKERETKNIYPPAGKIFTAFDYSFDNISIVILGQDCYHGKNQAHGLAFSCLSEIPPSLNNIYKELVSDLGINKPTHGDLTKWAEQGVFLLNTILTVEESKPLSHQNRGWENFTLEVLNQISDKQDIVFMLWGNNAKSYLDKIKNKNNLFLTSGHPSPLSYRYFAGNRHFSKTNEFLISKNKNPIDWSL